MGDSHFARCLQGGGVYVEGSSVTFDSCTITGNSATNVRAHACKLPIAPMGKCLVDMSISILIFNDGCCLQIYQYGVRAICA